MKKHLLGLAAVALVAMTSCSSEEVSPIDDVADGEEMAVNFTVNIPEYIQTRAWDDGSYATKLAYAIYDHATQTLIAASYNASLPTLDARLDIDGGKFSRTVNLVKGYTYDMFFWAERATSPYTVDYENKTVSVDYTDAKANDYTLDAFYFSQKEFKVTKETAAQTITLTRPFAKVEIATSSSDYASAYGYTNISGVKVEQPTKANIEYTSLKVSKVYTKFDLMAKAVVSDSTQENVAFSPNTWLDENGNVKSTSTASQSYNVVATTYLFPGDENVDVTFAYGNEGHTVVADEVVITNVPLKANYKTIVYGDVFTKAVEFSISIKPAFSYLTNKKEGEF